MAAAPDDDVTAREKAEEQLRSMARLFECLPQGVVGQDADGTIVSMNPAAERILGKSHEEFLGETSVSVQHHTIREDGTPFPGEEHPAMVSLRTGSECAATVMGVFNPREKAYRWINISAVPLCRPHETRPYLVYTLFEDITARKQAQDALGESEVRHRMAAQAAMVGTYSYDFNTREGHWSPELMALWGLNPGDQVVLDENLMSAGIHPADRDRFVRAIRAANDPHGDANGVLDIEYRYVRPDGSVRWLLARGRTEFVGEQEQRRPGRLHGATVDITRQKCAEEALRASEATLQGILNAAKESIWLFSTDGVALMGNETALSRWGSPVETIIGRSIADALPPELAQRRLASFREAASSGPVEFEDCRAGMIFEHRVYPIREAGQPVDRVAVFSRDITERKRTEAERERLLAEVRRSAMELDTVFKALPYLVSVHDKDGRYLRANPAVTELFGMDPVHSTREEIAGRLKARLPSPFKVTFSVIPRAASLSRRGCDC